MKLDEAVFSPPFRKSCFHFLRILFCGYRPAAKKLLLTPLQNTPPKCYVVKRNNDKDNLILILQATTLGQ